MAQFFPLLLLLAIFYFLIIRPQQQAQKKHKEMVDSLQKGDQILTNGGLLAEVIAIEDEYIKIKLSDTGSVKLDRAYVAKKIEG